MSIELKENPDFEALPEVKAGDTVLLEKKDWTPYTLKALVTNRIPEEEIFTCKVVSILDKEALVPVRGSDPLGLIDVNIPVERRHIQGIIE